MYTIGQLSKQSGLSRSTLLYYDRKGLLSPTGRTNSNYRVYSENDLSKLKLILNYRQTGVSLKQIKQLLDSHTNQTTNILKQRLSNLNGEISELREQQKVIIKLLGNNSLHRKSRTLTKEKWIEILRSTGMTESDMQQWHIGFERNMPEAHQDFLESLGIDKDEIKAIRKRSRRYVYLEL